MPEIWIKLEQRLENVLDDAEFAFDEFKQVDRYENGQKRREATYKDDKLDGRYTEWHKNGQKKLEATYKDDDLHGLETWWHKNGQMRIKATYKDGKLQGKENSWYASGQKRREGTWKNGKRQGLETWWHENGQKKLEATWKNGKRHGLATLVAPTGAGKSWMACEVCSRETGDDGPCGSCVNCGAPLCCHRDESETCLPQGWTEID